jgi:integrase
VSRRIETLEPGIFRWIDPATGRPRPTLQIHYSIRGKVHQESAHTKSIQKARQLRALRIAAAIKGETIAPRRTLRLADILDELLKEYERNGRASLPSVRGYVARLAEQLGQHRAADLRTTHVEAAQDHWRAAGLTNATINRFVSILGRAYTLACRRGELSTRPWLPRLEEDGRQGREVAPSDAVLLLENLPAYVADFFQFALDNGIRRGQLARTRHQWVDLEHGVIVWPPAACKSREPHRLPLEGRSLTLVERLMADRKPFCPYLFHGRTCTPVRKRSKAYGCIGDFRKAWATGCSRAKLPVGRDADGYIFHDTRRTAATSLRAAGLEEADVMKITGHKTTAVFRNYDLGDTEALRDRLAAARAEAEERARQRAKFRKLKP